MVVFAIVWISFLVRKLYLAYIFTYYLYLLSLLIIFTYYLHFRQLELKEHLQTLFWISKQRLVAVFFGCSTIYGNHSELSS